VHRNKMCVSVSAQEQDVSARNKMCVSVGAQEQDVIPNFVCESGVWQVVWQVVWHDAEEECVCV